MHRKHKLDLDCRTDKNDKPQALVCTKNTASFERRLKKYHEDKEHLAKLLEIQSEFGRARRPTQSVNHR